MFSQKIISWYLKNKRDLPWRHNSDPYSIWISEIILQQTRVNQGLPYYLKFIEKFPTITDFAAANESEILRLWQGLGYYTRARNMHYTAQLIVNEYNGKFPATYKELLKLKGIGKYTAAAIASFAFEESAPSIDGNVVRVISRYLCFQDAIDTAKAQNFLFDTLSQLMQNKKSSDFNQALIEIGALICTPKNPKCLECPLNPDCGALQNKLIPTIPYKSKKLKIIARKLTYLVIFNSKKIWLNKRTNSDIWRGLYDFYLIEENNLENELKNICFETSEITIYATQTVMHILSHQKLEIVYLPIYIENENLRLNSSYFVSYTQAEILPKPIVIDNFLKHLLTFNR